jgi:hypothetical protein
MLSSARELYHTFADFFVQKLGFSRGFLYFINIAGRISEAAKGGAMGA